MGRQAGVREWSGIVISPEMIQAGMSRLADLRQADVDQVYAVVEVYWAMRALESGCPSSAASDRGTAENHQR